VPYGRLNARLKDNHNYAKFAAALETGVFGGSLTR
jgi:hypothetical protein